VLSNFHGECGFLMSKEANHRWVGPQASCIVAASRSSRLGEWLLDLAEIGGDKESRVASVCVHIPDVLHVHSTRPYRHYPPSARLAFVIFTEFFCCNTLILVR
jgi:hypothetical protein